MVILQGEHERKNGIHYEVDTAIEPLGEGGSGIVRKGIMVDERTGTRSEVAIKFLFDDMSSEVVERSKREASICIEHDNLIRMIGFVETDDFDLLGMPVKHFHVVSELLNGIMLSDILEGKVHQSGLPSAVLDYVNLYSSDRIAFARKVIRQVLAAVQTLHDKAYIHRDIDPTNIMVTDKGSLKLIDYGISKKIDEYKNQKALTADGKFIGKADYAAPELALGDLAGQNKTTDIYAVGILLYQILTGELPFNGSMYEILQKQIHDKIPAKKIKSAQWREIVRKATNKKQADRYQSASEFRVAVDKVSLNATDSKNKVMIAVISVIMLAGIALGAKYMIDYIHNKPAKQKSTSTGPDTLKTIGDTVHVVEFPTTEDSTKETKVVIKPVTDEPHTGNNGTPPSGPPKDVKIVAPPASSPGVPPSSTSPSSMTLSYGKYTGSIKGGYPNGTGKLVYSTTRQISKYDPQKRMAQPGDYVEGTFKNGFFTIGKHYNSAGELIEQINLGVADDVYEDK